MTHRQKNEVTERPRSLNPRKVVVMAIFPIRGVWISCAVRMHRNWIGLIRILGRPRSSARMYAKRRLMQVKIKNSSKHLEETERKFPFAFVILLRNHGKSLLLCLQLLKQYKKTEKLSEIPRTQGNNFPHFSCGRSRENVRVRNERKREEKKVDSCLPS